MRTVPILEFSHWPTAPSSLPAGLQFSWDEQALWNALSKLASHSPPNFWRHILVGFATDLLVLQLQVVSLIVIHLFRYMVHDLLLPRRRRSHPGAIDYPLSLGEN